MSPRKTAALIIVLYLAISLPLYSLNQQAVETCSQECQKIGYDAVISATTLTQKQCRCLNTLTREEKTITPKEN